MSVIGAKSPKHEEDAVIEASETDRWDYPENALARLEDFMERYPGALRAKLLLASLYWDEQRLGVAGAEKLFREILRDFPKSVAAMCGLALLHGHPKSGVSAQASVGLLSRAAALSEDPDIMRNLGNKAWEVGEIDRAIVAFTSLRSAAEGPRRAYFETVASDALEKIRKGESPANPVYNWPADARVTN